jgi:hypothetical protein
MGQKLARWCRQPLSVVLLPQVLRLVIIYLLVNVNILISVVYNDLRSLKAVEEWELSANFVWCMKLFTVYSIDALPNEYNYTTIDAHGGHDIKYWILLSLLTMKVHSQVFAFGPPFQEKEHPEEPHGK